MRTRQVPTDSFVDDSECVNTEDWTTNLELYHKNKLVFYSNGNSLTGGRTTATSRAEEIGQHHWATFDWTIPGTISSIEVWQRFDFYYYVFEQNAVIAIFWNLVKSSERPEYASNIRPNDHYVDKKSSLVRLRSVRTPARRYDDELDSDTEDYYLAVSWRARLSNNIFERWKCNPFQSGKYERSMIQTRYHSRGRWDRRWSYCKRRRKPWRKLNKENS